MGLWTLIEVSSVPIVQVLLVTLLGAFMATDYLNLLQADARRSLNKIVFAVFTPCLIFASLAKTVTLQDLVSWWFMPINIGISFIIGSVLGWITVKLLKPKPHLEGIIIATCSSGNLGNILIILIPAICKEDGNPFGNHDVCHSHAISYASFSLALGCIYIFTYTYQLVRSYAMRYKARETAVEESTVLVCNKDLDSNEKTHLLQEGERDNVGVTSVVSNSPKDDTQYYHVVSLGSISMPDEEYVSICHRLPDVFNAVLQEILTPHTLSAIFGFIFGTIPWLKKLIIGDDAPLQLIQDTVKLLGDATIPCTMLILGGNLTLGLGKANLKSLVIIAVISVRYIILPVMGIGIVKAANHLGFLPSDPLFQFVLMIQFTVPPAMNIGTMTQIFNVGQAECSMILLWTYFTAIFSLTIWSTVFMWILS